MKVTFELPFGGVRAQLALTGNRDISPKDYVLKMKFDRLKASAEEAKSLGLAYSPRLRSPYIYSVGQKEGARALLPAFEIPGGAQELYVEVAAWMAKETEPPYEAIRLQIEAPWSGYNKLTVLGALS